MIQNQPQINEQREQVSDNYSPADSSSAKLTKSSINVSSVSDDEEDFEESGMYYIFGHIISLLNLNGNVLLDLVIDVTSEAQYPIQFQNMSNELEVALWVAQH